MTTAAPLVLLAADSWTAYRRTPTEYPHQFVFGDKDQRTLLTIELTTAALVALRKAIDTVLDNPTDVPPTPWADLDMARLGAGGTVAFT